MLPRNLVSMDVEESIRGNLIDGVVLMCGCDKTTPSLTMGAASCDLPAIDWLPYSDLIGSSKSAGGPADIIAVTYNDRRAHQNQ
jgi:hypothetical protein